jgi:uncharacterized protein YjbI with pentapeptide repeats
MMANQEQLSILLKRPDTWNKWRSKDPEAIIDLRGANLRYADLHEADLRGANLYEANLYGADLSNANLSGADLHRADLRGANLSGANLGRANLRRADLYEASLSGADLSGANLSRASLSEANLRGAKLSGADLHEADLRYADLREADLSGANLSRANMYRANLSGADLGGADLRGASLYEANLSEVTRLPDTTAWLDANFERTEQGWLVFKSFGMCYQPPLYWKIEAGAELSETVEADRRIECAAGINVATRAWFAERGPEWMLTLSNLWKAVIPFDATIIVPYTTDGKVRTDRLILKERIE